MPKICNCCNIEKDISSFGIHCGKPRSECKECVNRKSRKYTADNKEKVAITKRLWKSRNRHLVNSNKRKWYYNSRNDILKYKKEYYINNRDNICRKNKEYHLGNIDKNNMRSRNWHKNNPGRSAELRNRYRERAKIANNDYNLICRTATIEAFGNRCFNCGSADDLAIDHHYCLNDGYGLSLNNAVVLCRSCNSSKGTKKPDDFYNEAQIREINRLFLCANMIFNELVGNIND